MLPAVTVVNSRVSLSALGSVDGRALQRPDAGLDDSRRKRRCIGRRPRVPGVARIVEQPRSLLRWIELDMQRPPRLVLVPRPSTRHSIVRRVSKSWMTTCTAAASKMRSSSSETAVTDPPRPNSTRGWRPASATGGDLRAKIFLLFGEIADEHPSTRSKPLEESSGSFRDRAREPASGSTPGNPSLHEKIPTVTVVVSRVSRKPQR
jgi:hypothetical protein